MGYQVLGYGGSGDHGWEERLRGLCAMLPEEPEVYSAAPEEDWRYGIGELASLHRTVPDAPGKGNWCVAFRPGNARRIRRQHGRPLLWGWSPTGRLSHTTARELGRWEWIAVTERTSFGLLRQAGLGKNIRLVPDGSFLVERQIRPLCGAFRSDTVGICPGVWQTGFEGREGLLFRSYRHLIRYILEYTRLQVALIPYCVKAEWDDTPFLQALHRDFRDSGRVFRREDGDCRVLRGDLSLCRCCVGSPGTVAGWCCGTPGLCLGASPRGIGLARELFGSWEDTVIPVASLRQEGDLTRQFRSFLRQEDRLRRRLLEQLPRKRHQARQWEWGCCLTQQPH